MFTFGFLNKYCNYITHFSPTFFSNCIQYHFEFNHFKHLLLTIKNMLSIICTLVFFSGIQLKDQKTKITFLLWDFSSKRFSPMEKMYSQHAFVRQVSYIELNLIEGQIQRKQPLHSILRHAHKSEVKQNKDKKQRSLKQTIKQSIYLILL